MNAPKSFNRFVGLLATLIYGNEPFSEIIASIFISIEPEDREIFLQYIEYLITPPVDTDRLKKIWDRSSAAITMKDGETVLRFLSAIKPICENTYRQMLDAKRRQTDA